jgi:hypothetical protein
VDWQAQPLLAPHIVIRRQPCAVLEIPVVELHIVKHDPNVSRIELGDG